MIAVVSWSVAERAKEIAIRVALGASRRGLLLAVMRSTLLLAATGAAIGLALAGATTHYLQSLMVDVKPLDPATFASACGGLLVIAWVASYAPARRTLKVDPIAVLKDR